MMRLIAAGLCLIFVSAPTQAQQPSCAISEATCILDAAWSASLILPDEKRQRLAPAFFEIALNSGDPDLVLQWESRFEQKAQVPAPYPDYGWEKADPIIQAQGVDGLIETANQRRAPLNFGRADALLSAGIHYRTDDPVAAKRLNQALFDLAQSASAFEKPNLAHAAAELAMARCDMDLLSRAVSLTDAPRNLRYEFWRARISGGIEALLSRVRNIDNDRDTREVRRVLDGYRAIQEFGYCVPSESSIGD